MPPHPETWLEARPEGLYCKPARLWIDPAKAVRRAVITHGHADHARGGHQRVYASAETLAIMATRYGEEFCREAIAISPSDSLKLAGGVSLSVAPAGHILGSLQVILDFQGHRVVISGDYKRSPDPTCPPFEVIPCDLFITEATFALPVFHHPPIAQEVERLLDSMRLFPDRCHLIGVYALGKCQRLILALREAGYSDCIYLHGALLKLCELYQQMGFDLGRLQPIAAVDRLHLRGALVLCPPSALADRWSRRLPEARSGMASGWMQIRARARQRRVELPLIISDHADWEQLLQTCEETGAPEVWVTHGREDALIHALQTRGLRARALRLLAYEDESPD